ncbi:hypothetical protein EJ03DRAFT_344905 [Teratosphaeria nubilosa]|uniref:Major facilitator superfamily transporter n=1 Tax=Teratosphaeria nubilosa TaxID=161662 RepID=A0A6G1L365_9PEZI|nr:hypothetical protein EJ03DRAFT_344905 [Teratosphaeria nubilosa]
MVVQHDGGRENYYPLRAYYNGVRTLVSAKHWEPENRYNQSIPPTLLDNESEAVINSITGGPSMSPVAFQPYPDYSSTEYLQKHQPVHTCYLDAEEKVPAPDIYAYPGVPQHMPEAFYGSHKMLGMDDGVCFDRFGRLGPYGYGHEQGGLGNGQASEKVGSEEVFKQVGKINYTNINWGDAQKRCYEKNKLRFEDAEGSHKEPVQRHAYILRAWTGYDWSDHQILITRAMVNELALRSAGEYDVHILLHVKDNSVPIWADQNVYRQTIEENIPREFWNLTTLWSEQLMMMYYPEPFPDNFANMAGSNLHGVYRSAHFALQWFSQQRPEYDFYWNWEMDLRYSGHYYEFNTALGSWAKKQPRKGLWERSRRFYFPKYHGDWDNFTKFVEQETLERDIANNDVERSGPVPVWGPVQNFPNTGMMAPPNDTVPPTTYEEDNYEWGVGEEADLITFNPIFDPSLTNWVFSWDMSGYNRSLPIPPRRAAIITVARLSKKLLNIMHEETWRMRHTGFPEMWPPTACFHHGLKAVYAPQPVYFDRDWELGYMNGVFNYPKEIWDSPFGWGEHNLLGSSFYYNSGFSGALWRRWLGMSENGEGGRKEEEEGTGRMCIRGTLHHPVKHEAGPVD